MKTRFESIISYLESFENVQITEPFKEFENLISGKIRVEESGVILEFETEIKPQYPFQSHEAETIRFINKELLPFNHVNADGSICIHTLHNSDLKSKLYFDIDSLKKWIKRYYVEGTQDKHYDHIVVPEDTEIIPKKCFLFTGVNHPFKKGDFGTFQYTFLARGSDHEANRDTFYVTCFVTGKSVVTSNWSSFYLKREYKEGI